MLWVKSQDEDMLHECSAMFRNECSVRVFSGEQWNTVGRYDTPEIAQRVLQRFWRVVVNGGRYIELPTLSDGTTPLRLDATALDGVHIMVYPDGVR